ncbi:MAG TPA: histidine kinase [Streptosporangiaceae bacterium]|nr:histidine kinase [Streptosporangiaceae bacterium]
MDLDLPVPARPARPMTLAALAVTAAVTATILAVGGGVLAVFGRDVSILLLPAPLAYAWMGCVLLARRPGHPMGPLLCLIGLADAFATGCYAYVRYAVVHSPGSLPFSTLALWVNTWAYAPATSLGAMVLLLVFPEGRLLSRRFRPALWAALAFIPLSIAAFAFYPQNLGPLFRYRHNPYAFPQLDWLFETCGVLAIVCGVVAGAGAVASMTLRWRRSDRVGRQQLKWLLAVLPFTVVSLIATLVFPGTWSLVLALPAGILMPIAIGIAVTRHRLYEIDILLNRAALYGLLTAGVAGVYLAVVVVAHSLFGVQGRGLPVQIIATVLAAAALWPLHDRVQRRVDRLFYGDRGVPYEALARLGRRVEEAADPETALNSVVKTIADSLRLPYAALELRLGDGWSPAATYGEAPSQVVAFPLTFQRETVGRLLVGMRSRGENLGPDDVRLLADLARQAGPAAHVVALRRALDASRAGLVTAREEERRRLRRDLHDGIGPTLAGLTLGLDTARARAADQPALTELLGKLKAETQRAVTDVRRIVYGLRPPALDDFGLIGSLREEVGRLQYEAPALTVTLDAPDNEAPDLPAATEVACYRIVTEALTNITRHALATKCTVRIRLDDQDLDVEVRDDGVGLPEGWRAGVGITSMRERVTELGGDLVIEPALPHGTRINARLPAREKA